MRTNSRQRLAKTATIMLLLTVFLVSQARASFFFESGVHVAFHSGADLVMGADFTFSVDEITYGNGSINIGDVWLNSTCDMTLTAFFQDNWFNYTVTEVGTQQIFNGTKPYNVWIDGVDTDEFGGWNYSSSVISVSTASSSVNMLFGDWHSFTFSHKDLSSLSVDSYVTWQLLNGSTVLDYDEGFWALPDGTYTLKTYYLDTLINSTVLDTATYGNTTITVNLQMKAHGIPVQYADSSGYIAFNSTISSISINSATTSNLTFTVAGAGNFAVTIGVPNNYTYILKDAVNLTGWVYDSSLNPDRIAWNVSSLSATYKLIVSNPVIPPEDVGLDWPDWDLLIPNFTLNIYTTLILFGSLPLVVAVLYVIALFIRGSFPPILQLVEVVGVLGMVSFLMLALIPAITAILDGYGFG